MEDDEMNKIRMEIIDYISNSNLDENMRNFFIGAILFEKRNNSSQYTARYEAMIEDALKDNDRG